MNQSGEMKIDHNRGHTKICNCPMRDGAHEANCPTNNEYDHYHCKKCDKPFVQYSIAFGMCQKCREKEKI